MQAFIWGLIAAFIIGILLGPKVIPMLIKLKFGQTIYDLGPEAHKVKQGTPTMGGIIFAVPMVLVSLVGFLFGQISVKVVMVLISTVGFGLIGFLDDYIKVSKKRSLGLTPMQKIVPQFVLSLVLSVWAYFTEGIGSGLVVPFTGYLWNIGWVYIPVMVFVLVGTVNSANLLDGVDGLLGGCSFIDFITMGAVCLLLGDGDMKLTLFCGAAAGAVMAFLNFNTHPAKVFMGDTGSFIIGGALVGLTMVTRTSLLLPLVALAMLVSSLSDIIQVGWFKITKKKYGAGRRIFRMAPLHHHFELGGMAETNIVMMYRSVTVVLCLLALLTFC